MKKNKLKKIEKIEKNNRKEIQGQDQEINLFILLILLEINIKKMRRNVEVLNHGKTL
jgi:hypothetical protein